MKVVLALIGVGFGLAALPASATAVFVPVSCTPPSASDCPGTTQVSSVPAPVQVQQIFNSSLFTSAGITGAITITGIALRPSPNTVAGGGAANTATSADLNVTLKGGTTATNADTGCVFPTSSPGCAYNAPLSTVGYTTVASGIQHLTTTNVGTPRPFDYVINFTTPLVYDPSLANNNLVLDLLFPANGLTNVSPGGAVFSIEAIGSNNRQPGTGGATFAFGSNAAFGGLVVEFVFVTPEPATFVLLGGGLLGIMLLRKRRA